MVQHVHQLLMQSVINFVITEGVDYNSGPYNVTFPVGSTTASFDIVINENSVLENNKMFNISITSITNDHIVDTPGVATVIIIDTTSKCYTNLILRMYVCN